MTPPPATTAPGFGATESPWGRSAIPIRRAADFTGLRLGFALQGFLAFLIVVTMLAPFRFTAAPPRAPVLVLDPATLALSFALFLPLGYALQLTRPRGAPTDWGRLLLVGGGLALLVEGAQLWLPDRAPAVTEALASLLGTLAGGWGYTRLFRRVRASDAVRSLALELPLMAVLYLLVPLLALAGLGAQGGSDGARRAWLVLPLVAAAGAILGGVHAGYVAAHPARRQRPFRATGGALLGVGLLPALVREPLVGVAAVPLFLLTEWWWHRAVARRVDGPGADLRFEVPTLLVVLPLFAAYLVGSSVWPAGGWRDGWQVIVPLFPTAADALPPQLFHTVERLAAFTLAGYLVAELAGRRADTLRAVAPLVLLVVGALAAATEGARGFVAGSAASWLMLGLLPVAGLFGARLYQLQRDHVRALIKRTVR